MKVHLYSHVSFATGYGRAGRELAYTLLAAGVELEIMPLGALGAVADYLKHDLGANDPVLAEHIRHAPGSIPDVVIVHTLPLDVANVLKHLRLTKHARMAKLVAYTTWEACSKPPPEIMEAWSLFNELWYPSRPDWYPDIPLHCVPHTFDPELVLPTRQRQDKTFRFYYVGAWDARKQPGALIRAFANAFTPADDVELVIHTVGMDPRNFHTQVATTGLEQSKLPKITLSNKILTDAQIRQLHADGDCFVTASRWEAFNLPAFDAMLANRNIIATKMMGSDVFLYHTPAVLVGSQLSPCAADVSAQVVGDGLKLTLNKPQGIDARANWREPDMGAISRRMQMTFEDEIRSLDQKRWHADREEHYRGFERRTIGKEITRYLETR